MVCVFAASAVPLPRFPPHPSYGDERSAALHKRPGTKGPCRHRTQCCAEAPTEVHKGFWLNPESALPPQSCRDTTMSTSQMTLVVESISQQFCVQVMKAAVSAWSTRYELTSSRQFLECDTRVAQNTEVTWLRVLYSGQEKGLDTASSLHGR